MAVRTYLSTTTVRYIALCLLLSSTVTLSLCSSSSSNSSSSSSSSSGTISKRWLYGLTSLQRLYVTLLCLLLSSTVTLSLCSSSSSNSSSSSSSSSSGTISKRWLYGLTSLQRLYVMLLSASCCHQLWLSLYLSLHHESKKWTSKIFPQLCHQILTKFQNCFSLAYLSGNLQYGDH